MGMAKKSWRKKVQDRKVQKDANGSEIPARTSIVSGFCPKNGLFTKVMEIEMHNIVLDLV
jgi:hypothetical protein